MLAAFEETYADDSWRRLDPYFTEDAVYVMEGDAPFEGRFEGRDNVLAYLRRSVSNFDRLFDERVLELQGEPRREGDAVVVDWKATYHKGGAPNLVIQVRERATFLGGRIAFLEDSFESGAGKRATEYMAQYFT